MDILVIANLSLFHIMLYCKGHQAFSGAGQIVDIFCFARSLTTKLWHCSKKSSHRQGMVVAGLRLHQARFSLWSLVSASLHAFVHVSFYIFAVIRITR